ncbi:peptidase [Methylacidiphilum kamchatkense Kam1]|uniref:Peptidase n=1 Tax=Methylacidiphilum kamchatkense Kam1 TaxID=1202785 RepID=A0A0C1RL89_9BACT|nr:TldD/PmbA family protein [Methylacidiphilum kamchatkense]KIE58782.1 peptidase [Methylacidiphilum kamchatkense Kam1]QDQ41812.1 putative Zn-dependent protease [Methylacidiphilum kamchatkense Kam1]
MILSESEARNFQKSILSLSKANSLSVEIKGGQVVNIRLGKNALNTNGIENSLKITLNSTFENRTASYTIDQLEMAVIERGLRRCEKLAQISPPDPEFLPPLGPQHYTSSFSYSESMGNLSIENIVEMAARILDVVTQNKSEQIELSSFIKFQKYFICIANSNGLFGYQKFANLQLTATARTNDGLGSGWSGAFVFNIEEIDPEKLIETAIQKAILSKERLSMAPGHYPVLLEPTAAVDLIGLMLFSMDGRAADEGRSAFSKPGGGNRIGEHMFPSNITIYSDPSNRRAPGQVFSNDGVPCRNTPWIQNGILSNLIYSRYWAKKNHKEPIPEPSNILMSGSDITLDKMIQEIDKAILVTRLWYIREVDPQSLIFTGLTRDGTFLIEKGKISKAVNNFRFNQSPLTMLQSVQQIGRAVNCIGSEIDDVPALIPPLLIKDFYFTSTSEAI